MAEQPVYDVVICGGGLAGLTLARQLKLQMPALSILLIERAPRPLPEAGFKVGESTVIIGAAYLQKVLQLEDYLKRSHIEKLGLRYYFPASSAAIARRPEMGRAVYHPATTEWQLDRGILENDLRAMVQESGVTLLEGAAITDIELSETGEAHRVSFDKDGAQHSASASWVVDATGRRRFLQKKRKLARETQGKHCNSSWFRIEGRLDISDRVPASEEAWHRRVPGNHPEDETFGRYNSTNHFMGRGYWVWLIPLSSNYTSVGIVALDEVHPFTSYNTYERSLQWLETHEPEVARLIDGREPLDFKAFNNYSYSTERVFSPQRWACTGEAGAFPDPFYSPGTDSIAFTNCAICEMIAQDRRGALSAALCEELNAEYLSWVNNTTENIHAGYPLWGDPVVGALKIVWDFNNFWLSGPRFYSMLYQPGFADRRADWVSASLRGRLEKMLALRRTVHRLFQDWLEQKQRRASFEWIDYFGHLTFIHQGALTISTPKDNPLQDLLTGCEILEELAQALFLIALEDTMPEELKRLEASGRTAWLDAWAIGLDPGRWEEDGLFRPESAPRDLSVVYGQLRRVFRFGDPRGS